MTLFHYITVKCNPITRKRICIYCTKFFRLNFNSKYISVQVKIRDISGQTYNIGKEYYIDVSDNKNLNSYKTKIIDEYENFLLTGKNLQITRFIFEYKPLDTMDLISSNNKKK